MAFPSTPTDGQTYTQFGRTFIYASSTNTWRTFKNSDFANPLTGNVTLGNISDVHISGGSSNQLITTDGNGNLTFTSLPDTLNPFMFL